MTCCAGTSPHHILLRATRADAAGGLTDMRRLADMLARVAGRITHRRLRRSRRSPCRCCWRSARKSVYDGAAIDELLDEAAQELIEEATAEETGAAAAAMMSTASDARSSPQRRRCCWPISPARCSGRRAELLVVADLHLEKGSRFASRGQPAAAL